MAYKKRTSSRTRRPASGYTSRKRTTTTRRRAGTSRSGRTVQTLRIVVEQPSVNSSVVPQGTTAARKAVF